MFGAILLRDCEDILHVLSEVIYQRFAQLDEVVQHPLDLIVDVRLRELEVRLVQHLVVQILRPVDCGDQVVQLRLHEPAFFEGVLLHQELQGLFRVIIVLLDDPLLVPAPKLGVGGCDVLHQLDRVQDQLVAEVDPSFFVFELLSDVQLECDFGYLVEGFPQPDDDLIA